MSFLNAYEVADRAFLGSIALIRRVSRSTFGTAWHGTHKQKSNVEFVEFANFAKEVKEAEAKGELSAVNFRAFRAVHEGFRGLQCA